MKKLKKKRKYGNKANWARIKNHRYAQEFIRTPEFTGYVTLLVLDEVNEPLWTEHLGIRLCLVDNGYSWLQQFPQNKHYAVTTMFNDQDEVVQWYIDITLQNGEENGIPWMDDLFLDIIVLPSGEIIEKDIDEIEEALQQQAISQEQYDLAWTEFNRLLGEIKAGDFLHTLQDLSGAHKKRVVRFIQ